MFETLNTYCESIGLMPKQTNAFQQLIAMVIELLEDGAVVEESKLFPDPDTGVQREVDVYAFVRGKVNQQEITIAVECVDRSRPMDVTWVEGMYGKHSVLQIADVVLLVSAKGFYHSAEVKAKRFGYKTVSPAISPVKLATTLGLAGSFQMAAKMAVWEFSDMTLNTGVPGQLVDDGYFRRADGSELLKVGEYEMHATAQDLLKDGDVAAVMSDQPSKSVRTVTVVDPVHDGQPLHVTLTLADDQSTIVTRVQQVTFTAKLSSSNRADTVQTEQGNFDGVPFGTGVSTLDGRPTRMVVAENADGGWKALAKWQYEVKEREPEADGSDSAS